MTSGETTPAVTFVGLVGGRLSFKNGGVGEGGGVVLRGAVGVVTWAVLEFMDLLLKESTATT